MSSAQNSSRQTKKPHPGDSDFPWALAVPGVVQAASSGFLQGRPSFSCRKPDVNRTSPPLRCRLWAGLGHLSASLAHHCRGSCLLAAEGNYGAFDTTRTSLRMCLSEVVAQKGGWRLLGSRRAGDAGQSWWGSSGPIHRLLRCWEWLSLPCPCLALAPPAVLPSASGDISRLSLNITFEVSYLILPHTRLNNPFVPKLLPILGPWCVTLAGTRPLST